MPGSVVLFQEGKVSRTMITEEHFDMLKAFRVPAFAETLRTILDDPSYEKMGFEERVIHMIENESNTRISRKIAKLNKQARFSAKAACMEDIIYLPDRSLDKEMLERLATCRFVKEAGKVVVISETGCGKSYIVQALGNAACRNLHSVRYARLSDMCRELDIARCQQNYYKVIDSFTEVSLLILDDFFTEPVPDENITALFDIIETRSGKGALMIASQVEPDQWHLRIGTKVIADSILDRITHGARFIDLRGPNMRAWSALGNPPKW
jgi:DNA replication protein DnaC